MQQISNFNDRFKEAFKDRSVTEFAEEIGVSKQAVSAYLNGVRKPKRIVTNAIAKALNVSPAWLMGYDVPMERTMPEISYLLNSDEKFVVDTMRSLNEQGVRYIVNNAQFASTQPDFINADDGKIFRAASSADNHDGEITTQTEEERERIAKATRMTSKNSNL